MSANIVKGIFNIPAVYNICMYEQYPVVLATAAFIRDLTKKKILIIKKSPHEQIDAGLWTVPGGKVHPTEPIIDSLKREVKEEVGLTVTSFSWIGEDVFDSDGKYFHAQHFLCSVSEDGPVVLESKMIAYDWVTKENMHKYSFPANIKKRIQYIFTHEPT